MLESHLDCIVKHPPAFTIRIFILNTLHNQEEWDSINLHLCYFSFNLLVNAMFGWDEKGEDGK